MNKDYPPLLIGLAVVGFFTIVFLWDSFKQGSWYQSNFSSMVLIVFVALIGYGLYKKFTLK